MAAVADVPLPTTAGEPIPEDFRTAGLSDTDYTVVLDANTVISRRLDLGVAVRSSFTEPFPPLWIWSERVDCCR